MESNAFRFGWLNIPSSLSENMTMDAYGNWWFFGAQLLQGWITNETSKPWTFQRFSLKFSGGDLDCVAGKSPKKAIVYEEKMFFWLFSKKRIYNNIPRTQMTLGLSWKRVIVLDNYVRCSNSDMSWFLSKAFDLHFRLTFILSGVWIVYFFCVCPTGEIT